MKKRLLIFQLTIFSIIVVLFSVGPVSAQEWRCEGRTSCDRLTTHELCSKAGCMSVFDDEGKFDRCDGGEFDCNDAFSDSPSYCAQAPGCDAGMCGGNPLCDPFLAKFELLKLIGRFLNYVPYLGIIIGGFVLIVGGFQYLTAGDNPKNAQKARSTITYAVIGIILSTCLLLAAKILVMVIPGLGKYISV